MQLTGCCDRELLRVATSSGEIMTTDKPGRKLTETEIDECMDAGRALFDGLEWAERLTDTQQHRIASAIRVAVLRAEELLLQRQLAPSPEPMSTLERTVVDAAIRFFEADGTVYGLPVSRAYDRMQSACAALQAARKERTGE